LPLLCQPPRMRVNDMTQSKHDAQPSVQDVALIVGGGPGISSSCARLFAKNGMHVAVAARNPEKPVLEKLESMHGVRRYACDASEPAAVDQLFKNVVQTLGRRGLSCIILTAGCPAFSAKVLSKPTRSWRSKHFSSHGSMNRSRAVSRGRGLNAVRDKEPNGDRRRWRRTGCPTINTTLRRNNPNLNLQSMLSLIKRSAVREWHTNKTTATYSSAISHRLSLSSTYGMRCCPRNMEAFGAPPTLCVCGSRR
jgi:hypothetical protein